MATHVLDRVLPEDLVERISKDVHQLHMQDVRRELNRKARDIEFIFRRFMIHTPILLPVMHITIASTIKHVLPDLEVYLDAWDNWSTTIFHIEEAHYLVLHREHGEDGVERGFLADVRFQSNQMADILKQQSWGTLPECVSHILTRIFNETLGIEGFYMETSASSPFHNLDYIHDFVDLFSKYQFRPNMCPNFVHLLV